MRGSIKSDFTKVVLLAVLLLATGTARAEENRFQPLFDDTAAVEFGDSLSLAEVLTLVARANPTLRALDRQVEAAERRLQQAGLWPNPELETEFEEVGWDAPGLSESEITVLLSQELELFGQRGARSQLAEVNVDATKFATMLSAFDLYLEVKARFYALAHAQQRAILADSAVSLAGSIVDNITYRMEKGAVLQSELLLARLEFQRFDLARKEAVQNLAAAQTRLAGFWSYDSTRVTVKISDESDLRATVDRLPGLTRLVDSSRHVLQLQHQAEITRAERQLAAAEARPSLTLSGGYKRLQADGSNALLFGLSLPLPLFNRNQGTRASLESQLRALGYEQARARLEATANVRAGVARLIQSIDRHSSFDALLLPTAEDAYQKLQQAYKAGRVRYANLLEAERAFIELRFEHNDVLLAIHEQIIELERVTGITLYPIRK